MNSRKLLQEKPSKGVGKRFSLPFVSGGRGIDERLWRNVNLLVLFLILLFFTLFSRYLFQLSGFPGMGLRYLVAPSLVVLAALLFGARYLQSLYGLDRYSLAFHYLVVIMFGFGYPRLTIAEGSKQMSNKGKNLLDIIGGPGYLVVTNNNAAVIEQLNGEPRVCGPGVHYLRSFETIKEVISLEERTGVINILPAVTKDGVQVNVQDIRFRFQVSGQEGNAWGLSKGMNGQNSISKEAILSLVYHDPVNEEGETASWYDSVVGVLRGVITDYINRTSIDVLTTPSDYDANPRGDLNQLISSEPTRKQLAERGAELLWFDIGHFSVLEKSSAKQTQATWSTHWVKNPEVERAYSEAQRLAYHELGRAEGQAEIIMSILHATDDLGSYRDSPEHVRNALLVRSAEVWQTFKSE